MAKAAGVLCGGPVARAVFEAVDPTVTVRLPALDGVVVGPETVVLDVEGLAAPILTGERTALNFLQHLSGIATLVSRYVAAVDGTGAVIVDTRKTVPGLRALQKYAVARGGARNHRMGLGDGIPIKDNHIKLLGDGDIALQKGLAGARGGGRHIGVYGGAKAHATRLGAGPRGRAAGPGDRSCPPAPWRTGPPAGSGNSSCRGTGTSHP